MTDSDRKRTLKASFKAKEHEALVASMKLDVPDLRALLNHLDNTLPSSGCDHTLRNTLAFLAARNLDANAVVPWLNDHGGYCDCEVLGNVESAYDRILRA